MSAAPTEAAGAVRVELAGRSARLFDLPAFAARAGVALAGIPFTGRILIEAMLRAGRTDDAALLAQRLAVGEEPRLELPFRPARILVQDYTGIPLLVDLAALRDRVGDPAMVNPALPMDVVVDHSVQTDHAGQPDALRRNEVLELERNRERYAFLKWAASAFSGLRVVPPGRGIVHQVNLEQLATVVAEGEDDLLFPDTVIGTDSHTTMVNGLGVLGWGVGGLEAEALALGMAQPIAVPAVVGVRLTGLPPRGTVATDVVLTLTERLRREGVRGLIVEFTGPGLRALSAPDRCTIANMAPEYGAMTGFFPVDEQTLRYLRRTGRSEEHVQTVEAYCRRQGLWGDGSEPHFGRVIDVDLGEVAPSLAGPSRPDQRITLAGLQGSFEALHAGPVRTVDALSDGDLVIASITSCTSTSNPTAMLAAGLLARRAVARGLRVPRHVKTSLAPGSRTVTRYLRDTGLLDDLAALGFHVVGYGCMTCNGGSGPLNDGVGGVVDRAGLTVAAVLSGNRNFASRVHAQVAAGYLASPALVVALALVGHVRIDLDTHPLGVDDAGGPVYLRDIWPADEEVAALEAACVTPDVFATVGAPAGSGGDDDAVGWAGSASAWDGIATASGPLAQWSPESTYIRSPSYVDPTPRPWTSPGMPVLAGARVLVALGDDVSTDHISPVGAIPTGSPAGIHLAARGVRDLNSYGSRRGNHEVMARGTFSNPRLQNHLLGDGPAGDGGGDTLHLPTGERLPVYEVASRYAGSGTPLIVLAGRNYGMGSSRDWAAKGPWLLGVRAVLAESFERIHRANLCAMGILPLTLPAGSSWRALGITGHEQFQLDTGRMRESGCVAVTADDVSFNARAEVQSEGEWDVLMAGGALPFMLHRLGPRGPAGAPSAAGTPPVDCVRPGTPSRPTGRI